MSQVCEICSAHCRRIEGIFSQRQSREKEEEVLGNWDLLSSRGELGETIRKECTAVRRESLCGCTAAVCVCVCVYCCKWVCTAVCVYFCVCVKTNFISHSIKLILTPFAGGRTTEAAAAADEAEAVDEAGVRDGAGAGADDAGRSSNSSCQWHSRIR